MHAFSIKLLWNDRRYTNKCWIESASHKYF